ncbi:hypothetical protein MSG28_010474 [Choristoneura fumiferana]|uniref:Uncharacterized protein n=1 Tax=Choristoneura fumiferana TaxID=7141 RepID=A0ACC0KL87_CHOFU|nr:hypothetical protein MSG28_010474 [Choristoneura fumiferana]
MNMQRVFQKVHGQLLICKTYSSLLCSSTVRLKHSKNELNEHRAKVMGRGLPEKKPLPGVKSIIVVASGKGGVGKTTTAVNLACAMKVIEPDKGIGLLDADVFGPMSMGLLVSGENAVVWRGLMVMQALERLTRQVAWGPLDCLVVDTPPGTGDTHLSLAQNLPIDVVDTPPGTGDTHLSLAQNLPIDGALVVTTPQSAALQVTRRGVNMFEKLKVPIIGLVENMSHAICSECGAKNYVGKPAIYALPDSMHAENTGPPAPTKIFSYIANGVMAFVIFANAAPR